MRYLTLLSGLIIIFSSCTTAEFIQHTPTLVNSGMHTGKDQFTGRALYSSGSSTTNNVDNSAGASPYQSINGFQAQGSYSVASNLAIMGSHMYSGEKGDLKKTRTRPWSIRIKGMSPKQGWLFSSRFQIRKGFSLKPLPVPVLANTMPLK